MFIILQHWWGIQIPVLPFWWTVFFRHLHFIIWHEWTSWRYCWPVILFFSTRIINLVANIANYLSSYSICCLARAFSMFNFRWNRRTRSSWSPISIKRLVIRDSWLPWRLLMMLHTLRHNIIRASSKCYSCRDFLHVHVIRCTASVDVVSLTAEWLFTACLWCLTWCHKLLRIVFWLLDCCNIKATCLLGKCCKSITITAWFGCLGSKCSTVFFLFAELSMNCLAKFRVNLTCSAFCCLDSFESEKSSMSFSTTS